MSDLTRRALDQLTAAIRVLIVILAILMLVALSLQVVMRLFFNQALSWSEELALGCFSWVMLLAIAVGVRDAIHVRMDLLVDLLPKPLQRVMDVLVSLSVAGLGLFVTWAGVRYVMDSLGTTSAAIGYPIAFLYACAPTGGALIAIYALERAVLGPAPAARPVVDQE
ncbi:MAG: TRAP transporter small permease [Polaromonas sp.]|nr:TRAP transporter small permease [Polaromonas sp.]